MMDPFVLSDDVAGALSAGRPVVALETSVLAQGLPSPHNVEAAGAMAGAIVGAGGVPAWIWVDGGSVRVGASEADVERLATSGRASKVARRDLPMAVAGRGLGATTVSATLWAARRAGIGVAATGGIGGVHPGSGDVSADLIELARTPGTLVCSGPKSILDPIATLERLEELGIGVVGYRCDRLPFFVVREAPAGLEHRADSVEDVAVAARARAGLGIESTLLVCNPVPAHAALSAGELQQALDGCLEAAGRADVRGKAVTPFLLSCLARETDGASLAANLALLSANAELAARIASIA